jgi:hypothetical protein
MPSRSLTTHARFEAAIEASDSAWSRSLVRLDVATALARMPNRDLELAVETAHQALLLSTQNPIHSVWQRAWDFGREITGLNFSIGLDFEQRLRSWASQPAVTHIVSQTHLGSGASNGA